MSDRWTTAGTWLLRIVALLIAFAMGAWLTGGGAPDPQGMHVHSADEVWTCSMHPQIRQDEPGSCPICGMDLVPTTSVESSEGVVLSDRARALARLQTTPVRRQSDSSALVRLLGRLEPAETTRRTVTTWIGGRIDRLHVNVTGVQIRRGQVVATLYSPEVYGAHQDLITAMKQVERLDAGSASAQKAAEAALQAARDRLELLGVPESELQTMATETSPTRAIAVRSPFAGTVIERVATEGAYVETGAALYRIADLGTLWVQLDAYEGDLARLAEGQPVELQVDAVPGEIFSGRVAFIEPTVDPQRRTARVRVEVDNPEGRLRPGMFAEAVVSAGQGSDDAPLVIPDTAPLFTGKRSVVYVEQEAAEGRRYVPRTVRLGPRLGDHYPVVSGLSEGERVVSRGAFVIDADLQIRGGPSMMSRPGESAAPEPVPLSREGRAALVPVVERYLEVQRALAEDDHPAASTASEQLVEAIDAVSLPAAADAWHRVAQPMRAHADQLARSSDLSGARAPFEPLSAAVEALLLTFGNPLDAPLSVAFCPMAHDNEGARWVQQGDDIDNAYFGASMRTCGEITDVVAPDAYMSRP